MNYYADRITVVSGKIFVRTESSYEEVYLFQKT